IKNLFIYCSSDADQPSWRADEFGRGVFAHYVIEGLKGAAAYNDLVTAAGLFDFVDDKVSNWARQNRAALQKPKLIGSRGAAADFRILQVSTKYEAAEPTPPQVPGELAKLWGRRDALQDVAPHPAVHTPHLWRRYLDMTLRAEELLRVGDAE